MDPWCIMKTRHPLAWLFRSCLVGALGLGGCASLSESECQNANWHIIGYEDGAAGRPAARLGEHREACSDYGISPDLQAYRRGRDEGLREFCQPRRAYQLGRNGGAYPHACTGELEQGLLAAYRDGRELHELESEIGSIRRTLQRKENELRHIEQTQASHQAEIVRPDTSGSRRVQLLSETWDLVKRKDVIAEEIDDLNAQIDAKRLDLSDLQSATRY